MEQGGTCTSCEPALSKPTQMFHISPGRPLPLSVQDCCDGFNFAIYSRHAERVALLIFDSATEDAPLLTVELDPIHHRTGDIWHALIDGVGWGQAYAFRVSGPWAPKRGLRLDSRMLLLDPYALAVERSAPLQSAANPSENVALNGHRSSPINRRFDCQGVVRRSELG